MTKNHKGGGKGSNQFQSKGQRTQRDRGAGSSYRTGSALDAAANPATVGRWEPSPETISLATGLHDLYGSHDAPGFMDRPLSKAEASAVAGLIEAVKSSGTIEDDSVPAEERALNAVLVSRGFVSAEDRSWKDRADPAGFVPRVNARAAALARNSNMGGYSSEVGPAEVTALFDALDKSLAEKPMEFAMSAARDWLRDDVLDIATLPANAGELGFEDTEGRYAAADYVSYRMGLTQLPAEFAGDVDCGESCVGGDHSACGGKIPSDDQVARFSTFLQDTLDYMEVPPTPQERDAVSKLLSLGHLWAGVNDSFDRERARDALHMARGVRPKDTEYGKFVQELRNADKILSGVRLEPEEMVTYG